jgi:hypothetical protein
MEAARRSNGQFKKGVSGNPKGRPKKEREERYYEITMSACTFADWKAIVKRAVMDAKRGDATARKWLSDYLIGSPQQRLDVTSGGSPIVLVRWDEPTADTD